MTKIIFYVAIGIAVFGAASVVSTKLYNAGIQAERAETLKKGVELVQQRDKIDAAVKNATAEDICRALGGKTVNGECI